MLNFDFEETASFWNVGMLKSLLASYPDDTAITVCGTAGLFIPEVERQGILLETMDQECYYCADPATDGEGYMDF